MCVLIGGREDFMLACKKKKKKGGGIKEKKTRRGRESDGTDTRRDASLTGSMGLYQS